MYEIYYIYFLCECVLQKYSLILKCPTVDVLPQGSSRTAIYLELVYSSIKELYVKLFYIYIYKYKIFIICPNLKHLMYKIHTHFHKNWVVCWRNVYDIYL